jgi:hypothetical protein
MRNVINSNLNKEDELKIQKTALDISNINDTPAEKKILKEENLNPKAPEAVKPESTNVNDEPKPQDKLKKNNLNEDDTALIKEVALEAVNLNETDIESIKDVKLEPVNLNEDDLALIKEIPLGRQNVNEKVPKADKPELPNINDAPIVSELKLTGNVNEIVERSSVTPDMLGNIN